MNRSVISCLVLGAFLILAFGSAEEDPEKKAQREEYGDKLGAWVMAQLFVEQRLKSPGTAEYGWQRADECVTDMGEGEYLVQGWVDSQNSFGATVRAKFSLRVQYIGNEKWRLVEIPIILQR